MTAKTGWLLGNLKIWAKGQKMPHYYTIVAHARSGSTLLCSEMARILDGRIFLEIFHQDMSVLTKHLENRAAAVLGADVDANGALRREQIVRNPMDYVSRIAEAEGARPIAFKVFPGHLDAPQMQEVLAGCAGAVVLYRNLLHSFLSLEIAKSVGAWSKVDTSHREIAFNEQRFREYVARTTSYYATCLNTLDALGKVYSVIDYEKISSDAVLRDNVIRNALEKIGAPLRLSSPIKPNINRQDKRQLASEKVSNVGDLRAFLKEVGLEASDDSEYSPTVSEYDAMLKTLI